MRQSQLILSNAVIMWAARVLLLFPQLILVPYLIGTIGESGYGVYALVWSLMIPIERLQMALQQGVVKYAAGFLAEGRTHEVNKVVSSHSMDSLLLADLANVAFLPPRHSMMNRPVWRPYLWKACAKKVSEGLGREYIQ